jgi:hypothetical protein
MRKLFLLSVIAALGAALVPAGQGAGGTLIGTVGPGFTISLMMNGQPVKQLDPGDYTIQVSDQSDLHDFHLSGPGVNQSTDVPGTGDTTWNVTFVDGTYSYVCDVHVSTMHGSFRVGPPPPTVQNGKLFATVGPGKTITLGMKAGKRTATVTGGSYSITVVDRSRAHSFHLSGPGVNKKTGIKFTGKVTWKVTLKTASSYRYWSDANPSLGGTLKTS